jgi:hypothetical protein
MTGPRGRTRPHRVNPELLSQLGRQLEINISLGNGRRRHDSSGNKLRFADMHGATDDSSPAAR